MEKLLILINTLQGGGAEKVLVDTVNSLDSHKYQITVQTLYDVGIYREKLSPNIRYKSVVSTKSNLLRKIWGKILFRICSAKLVYNYFVRDDYDYEIAFLEGLPTKIISNSTNDKATKYAWIHTDLESFPDSYRVFGTEEMEGVAYQRFDKIFCVSDAVRQAFERKYGKTKAKGQTLYNIIDDKAIYKLARQDAELPTNIRPCFISVGRLTEEKGFDRLLRVHKRLINEGYLHSLIILGEGEKRTELDEYIHANNLEHTTFLLGFQPNPHKYVSKADLFICSSYAEGFSTVVSESLICGTPVISTDVAGAREPIEEPRCSCVVENDEQALYEALLAVLKEPELLKQYRSELGKKQDYFRKEKFVDLFEKAVFTTI